MLDFGFNGIDVGNVEVETFACCIANNYSRAIKMPTLWEDRVVEHTNARICHFRVDLIV